MYTINEILVKTAEGRSEMSTRALGLPVMERRLLILIDGTRSLAQLQGMFNFPINDLATKLQGLGLVDALSAQAGQASVAAKPAAKPADKPAEKRAVNAVAAQWVAPLAGRVVDPILAKVAVPQAPAEPEVSAEPAEPDMHDIGVDVDLDAALAEDLASDFSEEMGSDWLDRLAQQVPDGDEEGDTQPGLLTHRAASSMGLITGKAYLIETVETMLSKDGAWLVRKIASAQTEADLYYSLELLVTTIGLYTSQSSVKGIVRRFEEKISQR